MTPSQRRAVNVKRMHLAVAERRQPDHMSFSNFEQLQARNRRTRQGAAVLSWAALASMA